MPRPSRLDDQRVELTPLVADAFAELGYRRASTAELAARCGVQVNILYRLWPDKEAMFIAALDYVRDATLGRWTEMVEKAGSPEAAVQDVLDYESRHLGQFGYHRLVFTGLSETDDPEIRSALCRMYSNLHELIRQQIGGLPDGAERPAPQLAAWAILGLGTVATIHRELGLTPVQQRKQLLSDVGKRLLGF